MQQKIISFPNDIDLAITRIFSQQETNDWLVQSEVLHKRYLQRERDTHHRYIATITDALAYLALRSPATYAQSYGAMSAVAELLPSWNPSSLLDLGSGPGVSTWAAKTIWKSLSTAVCIDQDKNLLDLGEQIMQNIDRSLSVSWRQCDVTRSANWPEGMFDLIVLSNVLNELSPAQVDSVIGQAWNACSGILLVVESGTPFGSGIVSSVAKKLSKTGNLVAPYIANQFISNTDFYLHFPQRFIRPDFARRVRQRMREKSLMASDWEEAKYSYVAIGRMEVDNFIKARSVGPVRVQKGFLEVPILTKDGIEICRVMKRDKENYAKRKRLQWGQLLAD
jgi:ribosomal protein RSM22 (predicted rRNA methylase)